MRIQIILTVFILVVSLVGIGVDLLIVTVAIPVPSLFTEAPRWVTFAVAPGYIVIAVLVGTFWITRRTVTMLRWAIEEREPTPADERNTFVAPRAWRSSALFCGGWGRH
ncbi:putative adenylate cyclase [Mycobacterium xenopi 4042]|uniref:Putative adenylate cyclase n=1 Tax=Mycobacterium xenopi 4042 TaxID=1299334 RepID=X8E621_MYCXE|nr:putative adenylate cyclase [Mycobacterium xenopi 4042]